MDHYQQSFKEAVRWIEEQDDFLIVSHVHPDGDATGSLLAMAHLLKKMGKTYTLANDGPLPKRFSFLEGFHDVVNLGSRSLGRTFSAVIALDAADQGRLGQAVNHIAADALLLNIDHHPTNTRFGTVNVIQPEAASTTEILFDLIQSYFPDLLHKEIAQPLYSGLLTDTGGFRYANTNEKVLRVAAALLAYDLNPGKIAELALETMSVEQLQLLKKALHRLEFVLERKVAIISVSVEDMREAGASKDDVDGLVSYARNVEGVEVGVLLKEISDSEVKVSLRSRQKVNVATLAQSFGGGGHVRAAGYTFAGTLDQARQVLIKQLREAFIDRC